MRKLSSTGLLFILFLISSVAFSQSSDANYLKFDYLKVEAENAQEYLQYMSETWKPLYQQQVASGKIDSWSLYRVFTPGGAEGKYNFVAVTAASNLDVYQSMQPRQVLLMDKKSQREIGRMMERANDLRTVMFTEFWKAINKIDEEQPSPHPAKFMMVDYMLVAPGKDYDYQMLEDEVAKPIHQERKEKNRMAGWELFSLITPGGREYGYNFATGNYFNELSDVEFGFTEDVVMNALPGTDLPELFDTIFATRSLVKSQVWELVERTE